MNSIASSRRLCLLIGVCLFGAATAVSAGESGAGKITQSEQTGPYTVRLEILPPEPFVSQSRSELKKYAGQMVNGRGAKPIRKGSAAHPNHHMAVFVMRDGHVVEDALVQIHYRAQGSHRVQKLPVSVMWVAGTPRYKTTHFGNNVYLANKAYDIEIKLNHRKPLQYHVDLGQQKSSGQS